MSNRDRTPPRSQSDAVDDADPVAPPTPVFADAAAAVSDEASAGSEAARADKARWRSDIRAARRALPADHREELAQALTVQALDALEERLGSGDDAASSPGTLAAYFSAPDEPDTAGLLAALVQLGYEVYLPVCEPQYQLSWTRWEPETELVPSPRAPVLEPVGERHGAELFEQIQLMFIPALAIDAAGLRLGQGGGYYDRFLPQIQGLGTRLAALVYDHEFLPAGSFTVAAHDRPVGLVITPSGRHELNNGF